MSKILVVAETNKMARELCEHGTHHGDEVYLFPCAEAARVTHAADFLVNVIGAPEGIHPEQFDETVYDLAQTLGCKAVFYEASTMINALIGRIIVNHDVEAFSRVTDWRNDDLIETRYYLDAGHRLQKVKNNGRPLFLAFSPGLCHGADLHGEGKPFDCRWVSSQLPDSCIAQEPRESALDDLATAKIVVGIGRGVFTRELLAQVMEFAEKLGAGVGCTLPLHDERGWFPRVAALGVSELMISPRVYIALGVSGRSQHIAGITAHSILSVNYDKFAEVFRKSDYGIVARVEEIMPYLQEAARELS